jgi:hypothetical protein
MKDFLLNVSKHYNIDIDSLETLYQNYIDQQKKYSYHNWFNNSTDFGDTVVEPYLNEKLGMTRSNSNEFDSYFSIKDRKLKIEIKAFRCTKKKTNTNCSLFDRAMTLQEWKNEKASYKNSGSFQQIKPRLFDFLLGAVVSKDDIEIILVPSSLFCFKSNITSPIVLSSQHRGNAEEGQISYKKLESFSIGNLSSLTENKFRECIENWL